MRAACAAVALSFAPLAAHAADPADGPGETILVTPARVPQPAADAASPVAVITRRELRDAKGLDEALRDDPSFATFRRSSSLVADPSSQGLNLRGVGPSGVSRALVLQDGIPANDGFGGWVYWGAVPRLALGRVEIAPGVSSALYGSSAMGGVVQLISRPIYDRLEVEAYGGNLGTADAAVSLAKRFSDSLAAAIDAEGLTTDGYQVQAAPGAVDHDASSRRTSAQARLEARDVRGFTLTARAGAFAENEDGGTQDTTARARQTDVALVLSGHGLDAHLFYRASRFDQTRARLLPDAFARASATLASSQGAPADEEGLAVVWRRDGFSAGVEGQRVFGRSLERLVPSAASSSALVERDAAGEQLQGGVFAQELLSPVPALRLQLALRLDGWRNRSGGREETLASGAASLTPLPGRSDAALSPRLGVGWQAASWLKLRAAGYRSFRAPNLNELYRPFQAGAVRTDANPDLGPETLLGAEAGLDLGDFVQATAFLARLDDPIVNATVGPNQQERQNLGAARIAGLEVHAHWKPVRSLAFDAGWTYVRTRVLGAGRELPQDPRHRLVAGAAFDGWLDLDVHVRWFSSQFEDDLNAFRLPGYAVLDASASRRLSERWTVFAAAENALDRRYLVGLQGGVATVGQPVCIRAGFRLSAL